MLYTVAFVVATVLGFAVSRLARRPASAAQAAAVGRTVSGSLGGRRGLDAPELQRACFSEMMRHVRVNRRGRTIAPSRFVLRLNPGDLAVVDDAPRWFTEGLAAAMVEAAQRNGWALDGEVHVDYEADPTRRPGAPLALVPDAAGTPSLPPVAAARAAGGRGDTRVVDGHRVDGRPPEAPAHGGLAVVRADTGERIVLDGAAVTVGRATDNTITSLDERISRAHARFERAGSSTWVVVDLGSANGTRVDGVRATPNRPLPLRAGSVVGVGPLELRVEAHPPTPADRERLVGTRALDDADRTRISGEVLGFPAGSGRS